MSFTYNKLSEKGGWIASDLDLPKKIFWDNIGIDIDMVTVIYYCFEDFF